MTISRQYALEHFDEVCDRAERGEDIVLERPGKAALRLVPQSATQKQGSSPEAVQAMIDFMNSRPKLEGITVRQLIEEGRKY